MAADVAADPDARRAADPDADLVIIGGGPVGLVASLEARRAGLDVVVIEPRDGPIDKACGQGIMPAGVAHLRELGVEPDGGEITGITYLAGPRRATANFRHGCGLGVRRTVLHAALLDAVNAASVRQMRDAATGLESSAHSTTVRVRSGEEVRGAYVLVCDGLHSQVRRQVSPRVIAPRLRRFGFVAHVAEDAGRSEVEVHWSPSGEAYVTPLGRAGTGLAVLTRAGTRPEEVLAELPEVREIFGVPERFTGAGAFLQVPTRHVRDRTLLVGDAAGYVDALTGEGLTVGFAQARAAIAAILSGNPQRYERDWWRVSALPLGLAAGLVGATSLPPVRRAVVPAAQRLPAVFGGLVSLVAGSDQLARRVTTGARRTANAEMTAARTGTPITSTARNP